MKASGTRLKGQAMLKRSATFTSVVVVLGVLVAGRAGAQCPVYADQWALPGSTSGIHALAIDGTGNLYVGDMTFGRIVKCASDGSILGQWGSFGTGDGQFSDGDGVDVAADGIGNVYVLDRGNKRVQRFTSAGAYLTQWPVHADTSTLGLPTRPVSIAVDHGGNYVYVADLNTYHIQKFTTAGAFLTQWGGVGNGDGQFQHGPFGIAVDAAGDVYVAEEGQAIQVFTSEGGYITRWNADPYSRLYGIAVDEAGNVYVVDQAGGPCCPTTRHRVKMFSSSGVFLCEWGSYGDGNGQFAWPYSIAVGAAGDVYVSDYNDYRIQKFAPSPVPANVTTWGHLKASYR